MESSFFFLHRLINKNPGRRYQDSPFALCPQQTFVLPMHFFHLSLCISVHLSFSDLFSPGMRKQPKWTFLQCRQKGSLIFAAHFLLILWAEWKKGPMAGWPWAIPSSPVFSTADPCKEETALVKYMQSEVLKVTWEGSSISKPWFPFFSLAGPHTMARGISGVQRKDVCVEREHNRGCC